jgi:hypothetical protein
VPKVLRGVETHLCPLEAGEGRQIGVGRIAGDCVALADALLLGRPVGRCQVLGVIGQGEEIQRRAVAREVAGVGGWMCALSVHHWQGVEEGVERVGRVNVEIAEQDVLRGSADRCGRREGLARRGLAPRFGLDGGAGASRALDLSGSSIVTSAGEYETRGDELAELA